MAAVAAELEVVVKVRDGQVANRPVDAAIGVTTDGRKDVLGLPCGGGPAGRNGPPRRPGHRPR